MSSQPSRDSNGRATVAADVKLIGYNMTLEHWSTEQPSNATIPFDVKVELIEVCAVLQNDAGLLE